MCVYVCNEAGFNVQFVISAPVGHTQMWSKTATGGR